MAKKSVPAQKEPSEELIVAHLIKYNLYLLSKAVVFASVSQSTKDIKKAIQKTQEVMAELDLASKPSVD